LKKLLITLVLIGIALVGAAYWLNRSPSSASAAEAFTLGSIQYGDMLETVSATGILQPHEVTAVGSELSGKVVEIYPNAEVNRQVDEGEALLKLDDRLAAIKLDQAKTAIRLAQADVERAQAARDGAKLRVSKITELLTKEVGFQKDLDEANTLLKTAEASVRAAEVRVDEARDSERLAKYGLDLTIVRVPTHAGGSETSASDKKRYTIIERKVAPGQLIGPPASAQLFTLASDLGQMQVHAQVSESDIGKMRVGLDTSFTVYAYSEEDVKFKGKVQEIRPMPTNLHGAVFYDVVIHAANQRDPRTNEWLLRPGMTAAVDFILRRHADVWKAPTEALSLQLDEGYLAEAARAKLARWHDRKDADDWKPIWVVDHQKPWPIFVRIGGRDKQGQTGIKDGQYNEILEWDPELEPKPDPKVSSTYPQVITNAPPLRAPGFFEKPPNVKLF
jgi:HlyD family secretion protein